MKLVTYRHTNENRYGAVKGDGIVELSRRLAGRYPDVKSLIAGDALNEAASIVAKAQPDVSLTTVELLPPIPNPDKIICVGVNYEEHRVETGREKADFPVLFSRYANSMVGHRRPMVKPKVSERFDYEGELVAVIGRPGRHISKADSLKHIAGWTCFNDGSVRDWQRHTPQFTPGKNFIGSGGCGPWLVTADEFGDYRKSTLMTRLNGQEVQKAGADQMTFDVAHLIEYISTFTELVAGDLIVTGTPGGVGDRRTPPLYMKPGDVCEVEVTGVGTLVNPVVDEAAN
jgi:2-keto-4-pentenoate hydratase/2-oxohepta-3-ene-1,7-dioic acid hydratase in catechol pathway